MFMYRMMISTPPLVKLRYLLSRFLSSVMFTLRIGVLSLMAIIAMLWAVRNRILYILVRLDCNGNIQRVIDADRPLVRRGFRISSDFQRQPLARHSARSGRSTHVVPVGFRYRRKVPATMDASGL